MKEPHVVCYMACACGNAARYINDRYEQCCGICPIKEGVDSIALADKGRLHQWMLENASRTTFDIEEIERIRSKYLFQTGNDHWNHQAVDELRWARRYLDAIPDADAELRSLLGRHPGMRSRDNV